MTVACAAASLVVGMAVHQAFLPETDGAKHALLFGLLDPFVLMVALPITGLAALAAFPCAFFLLLRTRLEKSIPVVSVATTAGVALGAAVNILVAVLIGLGAGIASMLVCSVVFREGWGRARPATPGAGR
jgi:hypothetical protein